MRVPALFKKSSVEIIVLTLAVALLFGVLLGDRPYSAPSESRYVEIGREMAQTCDFITPRLNYVKYFEKPPLFYWVQALWTQVAGHDFFHARVPTAFFSVLLCLLTYALGRTLHDRLTGLLSAGVMATCLYTFALSRVVLLDVPVSVFIVACLTTFLYAAREQEGRKRTAAIYGMYTAAAAAVLTKGLIGIVLPGLVVFLWLLLTGRWALLKTLRIASGTVLFLALTVPWHVLVWQHNPEQPYFYFIHEHWERYTSKVHGRYQPSWFFAAVLLAGLFPWTIFALHALVRKCKGSWQDRKSNGSALFLLLWIGIIFLFFSASDSKLIPYILPIFPAIAAITGRYFAVLWREQKAADVPTRKGFTLSILAMLVVLIAIAAAPSILQSTFDAQSKVAQAVVQGADDVSRLSIAAAILAVMLFLALVQGNARHQIIVLMGIAVFLVELGDMVADNYSKDSMQQLTNVIKDVGKPGDEIVSYDNYNQDLPLYLNQRITVVHWLGELEFGTQHEDTSAWMIDYPEFWKRWMRGDHRMFVILREDALERIKKEKPDFEAAHIYPLIQDGRNILMSNMPHVPEKPSDPRKK